MGADDIWRALYKLVLTQAGGVTWLTAKMPLLFFSASILMNKVLSLFIMVLFYKNMYAFV